VTHLHHKISALVDGEMHGSARYRALHHIGRCSACRHELEATLALKRRMAGLSEVEPSADLFASLDSATVSGRRTRCSVPPSTSRSRLGPLARRVLVGAGSFSVAVLSLAYVVGGPADVASQQVTPPIDEYRADFAGDTGLAPLADPAADVLVADPPASQAMGHRRSPSPTRVRGSGSPTDRKRAIADLRRAMSAPNRYAYTGVREIDSLHAGAATALMLDVAHTPRQGTSFALVHGTAHAGATFIAQRAAVASGGLSSEPLRLLADSYDLSVVSQGAVLGRPATVIDATRGDQVRARFWVDNKTGLLLRREMYAGGRMVRSTRFTSLHVSKAGFLPHLPPELEAPSTTELAMTSAPLLSDYGWTCPPRLPGNFSLTRLDRLETGGNVMRASYSDGLSTVSLFEQRGSLAAGGLTGFRSRTIGGAPVYISLGLPTAAVWESAGTVYTVVTDAPDDTATALIGSLPHLTAPPRDAGDRLATGLRRLAATLHLAG
jgi:hypothetical protein